MKDQKSTVSDIEDVLQEIGDKIEELISKGAEAGQEAKVEVEKKISELKENKTTLEKELKKGKDLLAKEFKERKEEFDPRLEESKGHLMEGIKQIGLALRALFLK